MVTNGVVLIKWLWQVGRWWYQFIVPVFFPWKVIWRSVCPRQRWPADTLIPLWFWGGLDGGGAEAAAWLQDCRIIWELPRPRPGTLASHPPPPSQPLSSDKYTIWKIQMAKSEKYVLTRPKPDCEAPLASSPPQPPSQPLSSSHAPFKSLRYFSSPLATESS